MMQANIEELLKLGPLPPSTDSDVTQVERYQTLLAGINCPVSNDEATALVKLFGVDDCFGLAWTLLHAIETAPGWPILDALGDTKNEWIVRLKQRAS
jgi:hypothetical protein